MNTYQFEEVRDHETGTLLWVGAREQQSPWRFFVWVANTGNWHRYQEFEPGAGWVDGIDFKEIDASAVPALVEAAGRIDERRFRWVMDEFRAQASEDVISSAQLGLDAGRGPRPTRNVALEDIPATTWMTLKTYGQEGEAKARSLASDIRLGKRKGWPAGAVESRTEPTSDGFEVQVRALTGMVSPPFVGNNPDDENSVAGSREKYIDDGEWQSRHQGSKRAFAAGGTKADQQQEARKAARRDGSEHVIKNRDGAIRRNSSYSRTSNPPKDAK